MNKNSKSVTQKQQIYSLAATKEQGQCEKAKRMNAQLTARTIKMLALSLLLGSATVQAQVFKVLHTFNGGVDGQDPLGSLTVSGSTLYGMTPQGGIPYHVGYGMVFKINTDGTGYIPLHTFAGRPTDGDNPHGSLTLSGSTLYGMTFQGGIHGYGTVFKMNTNGTGYSILHHFGGRGDGQRPNGSLILSGSTLYGMTQYGGNRGYGTVFKMNTNGTGFTILHSFAGGTQDGSNPLDSLTLSGSTLYGMTECGGANDQGTVFKLNTSGIGLFHSSGFSLLHSFAGGSDGSFPSGSLALSGSALYGMTPRGGDGGVGILFVMNTSGSGFSVLHSFGGGGSDGCCPQGSLSLSGHFIKPPGSAPIFQATSCYGMTMAGGAKNDGTVFKMDIDGKGYSLLHTFSLADGTQPYGSLSDSGSTLYGMTGAGGVQFGNLPNMSGTVFSYTP
jgi:uncharacterized repeat protein (TIGR03803 family)